MHHIITRIKSVSTPALYKIHVVFADDTEQTIDLEPMLFGPMYGPLRDPSLFNRVKVDAEVGTIVWPNGADFDPATLYKWDAVKNELAERALEWKEIEKSGNRLTPDDQ